MLKCQQFISRIKCYDQLSWLNPDNFINFGDFDMYEQLKFTFSAELSMKASFITSGLGCSQSGLDVFR